MSYLLHESAGGFFFSSRKTADRRWSGLSIALFGHYAHVYGGEEKSIVRKIIIRNRDDTTKQRSRRRRDGHTSGRVKREPREMRTPRFGRLRTRCTERRYTFNRFHFPFEIESIVSVVYPKFMENLIETIDNVYNR